MVLDVVRSFRKEDMARLLQFITGTSEVPLEGFRALQGISGPQQFQIHEAYEAPERLPSAHTCFNQLDLPDYATKDQLQDRLLLAIQYMRPAKGLVFVRRGQGAMPRWWLADYWCHNRLSCLVQVYVTTVRSVPVLALFSILTDD